MINCKQATELISQGLDRQLSLGERLHLRLHLLFCIGCRRTREQFDFMRDAMRKHPWKL
jgi:hypothetical protein